MKPGSVNAATTRAACELAALYARTAERGHKRRGELHGGGRPADGHPRADAVGTAAKLPRDSRKRKTARADGAQAVNGGYIAAFPQSL